MGVSPSDAIELSGTEMFSLSSAETASRACCTAGGGEKSVARGVVKWKDTLRRIVCSTPPPAAPVHHTRGGGIYWLICACRHNITVLERMEQAVLCLQRALRASAEGSAFSPFVPALLVLGNQRDESPGAAQHRQSR